MAEVKEKKILDPMQEEVEVFLPKVSGEAPDQFVSVGGKNWLIARGKKTMVPKAVALVLEESQRMAELAEQRSEEEQKKMKVIQGVDV